MDEVKVFELDRDTARRLGLAGLRVPVRRNREREIFAPEGVDIGALAEELDWASHTYETNEATEQRLATLTRIEGLRRAIAGDLEGARQMFQLGLAHSPESKPLRALLAVARQGSGDLAESVGEYEKLFAGGYPPDTGLLILAARAYADAGRFEKAVKILEQCPVDLLEDYSFREFFVSVSLADIAM